MSIPRHILLIPLCFLCAQILCAQEAAGIKLQWNRNDEKRNRVERVFERIDAAVSYFEQGKLWRARRRFDKVFEASRSLTNRGNAVVGKGLAHYLSENYRSASEEFAKAIKQYANYIDYASVLELLLKIGREHCHGRRDILMTSLNDEALEIYKTVYSYAPNSDAAARALIYSGDIFVMDERPDLAVPFYERHLDHFKKHPMNDLARFKLAEALLLTARISEGDYAREERARGELAKLIVSGEDEELKAKARELADQFDHLRAKRLLFLGSFHQRKAHRNEESSRHYLEELLRKFPNSEFADDAEKLLAKLPPATEDRQ